MKKVLLFIFILLPTIYIAQTVKVTDYASKSPLSGVHISNAEQSLLVVTDTLGVADISAFTENEVLFFSHTAYVEVVFKKQELYASRYQVALHPVTMKLDEFVISANKRVQSVEEVPNKLIGVTMKDIQLANPQTSADLIGSTHKVFVQKSQQSGGSPMIRGFAANKVLIVVDGVRMNNAIFREGNLQNIISIDPNMVEKAEVVFGPGSVIYGSDALGGVMDFNTLSHQFSDSGTHVSGAAGYRFSSANKEQAPSAQVRGASKKWSSITGVSYKNFGDIVMGSHGPDAYLRNHYVITTQGVDSMVSNGSPRKQIPTGFEALSISQKIGVKLNNNINVDYTFLYSTTTDNPRYDRLIEYTDDGNLKYARWDYGPQLWMFNRLGLRINKPNMLFDNLNITLAHQKFEESRIDRKFQSSSERHQNEGVNLFSVNVDFDNAISGRSTLFYGLEVLENVVSSQAYRLNIQDPNLPPTQIQSRYPNEGTQGSYAAYINFKVNQSDRNTIVFGLRFNQVLLHADLDTNFYKFSEESRINQNTGALTGSIGFAFRPNHTWQINGTASSGFKAPNLDDIAKVFDSEPGAVVIPNTDLKPEYLYNIDVLVAKKFGKQRPQRIEFSGYYSFLIDAMVRRNTTYNGQDSIWYDGELSQVQSIVNASSAVITGFSFGYENQFIPHWTFGITGTYTYGVDDEGLYLRHVPPFFGTASVTYEKTKLRAKVYATYNAALPHERMAPSELGKPNIYVPDESGNLFSPSWYTLNIKGDYQLTTTVNVSAGVENITNQRYRPYSSGVVAPGINVFGAVNVRF